MEKRVYNFSAGPSMLPLEVLEQAQRELVCYPSAGMSVMEMSHRSKTFENILEKAKADLKELMHIPDNYKILFLQGGGSTQFAMIPMNLMNKNNKADYVITGQWAKKAAAEAERYGNRCFLSRLNLRPHPHTGSFQIRPRSGLFLYHTEQHHLRYTLDGASRYRQCAAGGRYVLFHSLAGD